jgi:hypothetical protein
LLALTVVPRAQAALAGARWFDIGLEADLVPEAAIAFVEQHGLRSRMYNDLEVGSYLTWQGWPRFRVFQDPRINGYPESFHAVLRRTDLSREEWQRLLDGFSVDAALLTYPTVNPRGAWFDPEKWALVYRAADGLVFTRRLPERAALIDELEIPLSFSYAPATGLQPVPLRQRPPETHFPSASGSAGWAIFTAAPATIGPPCAPMRIGAGSAEWDMPGSNLAARRATDLGAVALRLGEPAKPRPGSTACLRPQARTNHGFALLGLGQAAAALADFDAALAALPSQRRSLFRTRAGPRSTGPAGRGRRGFHGIAGTLARSPVCAGGARASAPPSRLDCQSRPIAMNGVSSVNSFTSSFS